MIYTPAEDSSLLAHTLPTYVKKKSVLDMGTGSGILAETAFKAKAKKVLAVDINPEAIRLLKKKGIPSRISNLFSKVTETFEVILFNPPYLPRDSQEDKESQRITTGGKKGDELILRFLKQAPKHLAKEGVILLLLSSLTPREKITSLLKKQKLKHRSVAQEKLFFETLDVWEITSSPASTSQ